MNTYYRPIVLILLTVIAASLYVCATSLKRISKHQYSVQFWNCQFKGEYDRILTFGDGTNSRLALSNATVNPLP